MGYLYIVSIMVLGFVAASGFIENKFSHAKTSLNFVKPFSGWVGLVSMVLGFYWLFRVIRYLGIGLQHKPILTIIFLASSLIMIVLGFVMAQKLIKQFSSKNKGVDSFVEKMNTKFSPLQEKLGLAAIGAGLINLLLAIT